MLTAAMKRLNLETDRNFFKTIFAIALPSAFQGLVSLLVVYLDDIMVSRISSMEGLGVPGIAQAAGNVGDIALAGVSQANAMTSLFTAATLVHMVAGGFSPGNPAFPFARTGRASPVAL